MASSPGGGGSPRRHSSDRGTAAPADPNSPPTPPASVASRHVKRSSILEAVLNLHLKQRQCKTRDLRPSLPLPHPPRRLQRQLLLKWPCRHQAFLLLGQVFWARRGSDWGLTFFIRVDIEGSFHTYPDVGGPFQSLQEAQIAIDRHLEGRRIPKMCMKQAKVSLVEMAIRTCLYFPDGTRKRCSKSSATEKSRDAKRRFVQALVDNHNNDHNLFGDAAYELKDVLQYYSICENHRVYYHFNFTAKTKGADDFDCGTDNLFFAEVKSTRQGEEHEELLVSCFCMLKPIDNGGSRGG